ncbi:MAG: hypothetical protein K2W93_05985 [Burkholderiaceae bacterium]|nr:hypothetical protein [Burkholderiaceae bacterium]
MGALKMLRQLLAALLVLSSASAAWAQGAPLPDYELSRVWGQAMVEVTNTSINGYDFSRVTLNADIKLNANFSNIRLGEYSIAANNGAGADFAINRLQFGRSDLDDAARTVALSNPYLELVYRNAGNASTREVIGMRLGFEGISGHIGLAAQSISGSLAFTDTLGRTLDTNQDPQGGKRWDGTNCGAGNTCPFNLANVSAIQAGDNNGPSRDFFISILKQSVQYPSAAGQPPSSAAMQGLWLNWRDRLMALNPGAALPPNLPKPGG